MLAIGQLRNDYPGVGQRGIATAAQRDEAIGAGGDEWDQDYIDQNELIYVPRDDSM